MACFAAMPAPAAVQVAPAGFAVHLEATVHATPERAWQALTADVGKWWNSAHSWSGDSHNLSIDARAGGCFCEQLKGGGSVEHQRVVFASPGTMLRLVGGLGPLQGSGVAGALTFRFAAQGEATRVELTYVVGGYIELGIDKMAPAVEGVLAEQLQRYARYVDTGTAVEPTQDAKRP